MKSLTIEAPDDVFDQAVAAVALNTGWIPQVNGGEGTIIDNPVSQIDHAKSQLLKWLGDHVRAHANKQADAAAKTIRDQTELVVSQMAQVVSINVG